MEHETGTNSTNTELLDKDIAENVDVNADSGGTSGTESSRLKKIFIVIIAIILLMIIILPNFLKNSSSVPEVETETLLQVTGDAPLLFEETEPSYEQLSDAQRVTLNEQMSEESFEESEMVEEVAELLPEIPKPRDAIKSGAIENEAVNSLPQIYKWHADIESQKLLDRDFAGTTAFYKGASVDARWSMSEGRYRNILESSRNTLNQVDSENLSLLDGGSIISTNHKHIIPTGTFITAVTRGIVDSDYPEAFLAKVTRPMVLRGWTIICKSGRNQYGRISVTIDRLISPEGKELTISGQVEMASTPGLTGRKHSRWYKRMAPSIVNAGIGGALLAYTLEEERKDRERGITSSGTDGSDIMNPNVRVSSTDQIMEPIIQDGIGGLQKEVSRIGQNGITDDRVVIPENTTFDILLLSSVTVLL